MPFLIIDALVTLIVTGGVFYFMVLGVRAKIATRKFDREYAKWLRDEEKRRRKENARWGGNLRPQPMKRLNYIKR